MVRPGRDRLSGRVEVDETYVGGLEEGVRGRQIETKDLVAIAWEEDGSGVGRMAVTPHPKMPRQPAYTGFVQEPIEPGSVVHTDGWEGYAGSEAKGYQHKVTVLQRRRRSSSEFLPRVHLVASLLKRWLLGTHQGPVSPDHLAYYLDEFTFRFNRRRSRSRGKLFYRLLQQAVALEPAPYKGLVGGIWNQTQHPQHVGLLESNKYAISRHFAGEISRIGSGRRRLLFDTT